MICRDASRTDLELLAQAGYHMVWLDLEHSHQSTGIAIELCRTASHLGMVPLVRAIELSRTHVQRLLDNGAEILAIPDTRNVDELKELVRLGKYPPEGERGVASSVAGVGYHLGQDPRQTLSRANRATHLMAMIESDEAYDQLDEMLAVDGVDLLAVGPADWGVSLGLFGAEAEAHLAPRIEHILDAATAAGKITGWGIGDPDLAVRYRDRGLRLIFHGPDVGLKRQLYQDTLARFRDRLG
jgi:2-keto-3-deoxy-L-rhamnonate aldolase RhmA